MTGRKFLIKVVNQEDEELYQNHGTYHAGDSGLDLFVVQDQVILPGETALVDLGVRCQSVSVSDNKPKWWCFGKSEELVYHSYFLLPRSSISKTPLMMRNSIGLIDAGYLGNIKAPLYNTSNEPFYLKRGQRYVQLIQADLSPITMEIVQTLRETTRGSGGFGSSGGNVPHTS
jgi:dUTP pyrophosphatase